MAELKDELKTEINTTLADLQRMRDEIRLKIHLGAMDAKDVWADLEPRLVDLEKKAQKTAASTGHEVKNLAYDLRGRFQRLRDQLS